MIGKKPQDRVGVIGRDNGLSCLSSFTDPVDPYLTVWIGHNLNDKRIG